MSVDWIGPGAVLVYKMRSGDHANHTYTVIRLDPEFNENYWCATVVDQNSSVREITVHKDSQTSLMKRIF